MKAYLQSALAWFSDLAPREQALVGAAGGTLALAFVWLVLIQPVRGRVQHAEARVATAQAEVEIATQMRRELTGIAGQLQLVEARVRRGPRGNLFTILESLAAQSAVQMASVEPQAAPSGTLYKETKVQVVLKQVTLAQAINFLHRIESADQLLSVKSLRVRTGRDQSELLDVTFSVSSFETI